MVIDAITYNNERELLELRLNILDDFVDRFVIMEATKTFSGKSKSLYFERDKELFKKWGHKIKYYVLDDWDNEEIWEMAGKSPNTEYGQGAQHWLQEFYIKEHLKIPLQDLTDEDIIFIGDCDEIWSPEFIYINPEFVYVNLPKKLKLMVYSYWLNNKSNEEFWGTLVACYKDIKDECLNHLRSNLKFKTESEYGWHFTSQGGSENVKKKLTDSYTSDSYANDWVLDNLKENISNNKDFLGRDFTYTLDESKWPDYLKNNRDKYKHLIKPIKKPTKLD